MIKYINLVSSVLNSENIDYVFFSPKNKSCLRDIDIVINRSDVNKVKFIIKNAFDEIDFRLINVIINSYSTQLFFFKVDNEIVQIDLMPEVSYRGVEYISSKRILREHVCKFEGVNYIDEAFYQSYVYIRDKLQGVYIKDSLDITHFGEFLHSVLKGNDEFMWYRFIVGSLLRSPIKTIIGLTRNLYKKAKRSLNYNGLFISILGPDGAGKSFAIEQLGSSPIFNGKDNHYLLPCYMERYKRNKNSNIVNTDPHGKTEHSRFFSFLKQFVWLFEYVMGYLTIVRPSLNSNRMVIFDRYYTDMLIDPKRYRYSGPMFILKICNKLIPTPDIIFVLHADARVIQSRKQEVSFKETESQVVRYLDFSNDSDVAEAISTDCPPEETKEKINSIIFDFLESRAKRKLENSY